MHFEIVHEFDIPLDALELAVISPRLVDKLGPNLQAMKVGIETVEQKSHRLADGVLDRVWHYQANVKVPPFARGVLTKEMCAWEERSIYDLKKHGSSWTITPHVKPEWQKYFHAEGTYSIQSLGDGRTRRVISGDINLNVPVVRQVAERMILGEVKKTFEAEAATLRDMATLI